MAKKKEVKKGKETKINGERELTEEEIEIELKKLDGEIEKGKDTIEKYPKIQIIRGVRYLRGDLVKRGEDGIFEYLEEFPLEAKRQGKKWYKPWTWFRS